MENKNRYLNINFCLRCGNKLTLKKDRENKSRPQCDSCGWIFYKNPIPAVACVVVNEVNQLLLVKRKYEPQAGSWALPGGYVEIWQNPEETAIAELKEETGMEGEVETFLGYYSDFSVIYEKVLALGFKLKIIGGTLMANDDAIDAAFFDITNLPIIPFYSHNYFIEKSISGYSLGSHNGIK